MFINYESLPFNSDGTPLPPTLVLKTLSEKTIAPISGVQNIRLNVKFTEPSELSFDVCAEIDGQKNPVYDELTGYKIVYTENYGVYVTMNPSVSATALSEVKHVECYSIERLLDTKKFFLENDDNGVTFKFYDATDEHNDDTMIGRILEVATDWHVGHIDMTVAQRYRTFDGYDDLLLTFLYGNCQDKYRCVFVFDPYARTINVYDADAPIEKLPIYLDFENLVDNVKVEELTDELATAIRAYGAEPLDISAVNPIGTNYIYDLSYFIASGDIDAELAQKWNEWLMLVQGRREYYSGLIALRASTTASLLAIKSDLIEYNGELDSLLSQQSITIQALAKEHTSAGKDSQQALLDTINADITAKRARIAATQSRIDALNAELDACTLRIRETVDEVSLEANFTANELRELRKYMIEQDMVETSFVAADADTVNSCTTRLMENVVLSLDGAVVTKVPSVGDGRDMYTISGGHFTTFGDDMNGDVIRGTLEVGADDTFIMSLYTGSLVVSGVRYRSATVVFSGSMSNLVTDVDASTSGGVEVMCGTSVMFQFDATAYITANVSDYQRYAVETELYDHALQVLAKLSMPAYEFSVEATNFIFLQEFAPFRDRLALGKSVYLNLGRGQTIHPCLIELAMDFEEYSKCSLVFSNRFYRQDFVNSLRDMVEQSYSASRSFESKKFLYNHSAAQTSAVTKFMNGALDAAKNRIIGAGNQSVVIDTNGIKVGGDSDYQMRIVDNMIAMTDDNWAHAKMALGLFASPEGEGNYYGVNAEVIGGKLLIGNNMILENETDDGVMQFKVDSSGAWLNNSTFVVQKDDAGKILIDPRYGIAAGTSDLFTLNGTNVLPAFIEDGEVKLDDDGFPVNTNLFVDLNSGDAYFRGKVYATDGIFNGTIYANNGVFKGTVEAAKLKGEIEADEEDDAWLKGCGIKVGGTESSPNFLVDRQGNVTMQGNINLSSGNITWSSSNSPVKAQYSVNGTSSWHDTFASSDKFARYSYDGGATWTSAVKIVGSDGARGTDGSDGRDADRDVYTTYIDSQGVKSPSIKGGVFELLDHYGNTRYGYMGHAYGSTGLNATEGICMAAGSASSALDNSNYIVATDAGVRMQSGSCSIYVTSNGCYCKLRDGTLVDFSNIESSGAVAVFG